MRNAVCTVHGGLYCVMPFVDPVEAFTAQCRLYCTWRPLLRNAVCRPCGGLYCTMPSVLYMEAFTA